MKTRRFQVLAAIWSNGTPGHKDSGFIASITAFYSIFQTVPEKKAKMSSKHYRGKDEIQTIQMKYDKLV